MIADETCCPDKYSQENGSLKSYNSLMRALKILTSHDFFSGDGNSACNNCFLVRSTCSDNRKLLQGLSANICLPCLGQVWLENRFEPFILPVWREGKEFMALLASFAVSFPLRRPSDLQSTELARSILARTEGTIGE